MTKGERIAIYSSSVAMGAALLFILVAIFATIGCSSSMTATARIADAKGAELAATSATIVQTWPWTWGDNHVEAGLIRTEDGATSATPKADNQKSTLGSVGMNLISAIGGWILHS